MNKIILTLSFLFIVSELFGDVGIHRVKLSTLFEADPGKSFVVTNVTGAAPDNIVEIKVAPWAMKGQPYPSDISLNTNVILGIVDSSFIGGTNAVNQIITNSQARLFIEEPSTGWIPGISQVYVTRITQPSGTTVATISAINGVRYYGANTWFADSLVGSVENETFYVYYVELYGNEQATALKPKSTFDIRVDKLSGQTIKYRFPIVDSLAIQVPVTNRLYCGEVVDDIPKNQSKSVVSSRGVYNALQEKYQKPESGIPVEDLSQDVQQTLIAASHAYQKPETGIPTQDLSVNIRQSLLNADTAYHKPSDGIGTNDLNIVVNNAIVKSYKSYVKPDTGIPDSDMSTDVRQTLDKANNAYQKPAYGIPYADLSDSVKSSLDKSETAYQKPATGVPASDLSYSVNILLARANTAYQKPSTGIPASDLSTSVNTALNKATSAYQKPSTGIQENDLSSEVVLKLNKKEGVSTNIVLDIIREYDETNITERLDGKFDKSGGEIDGDLSLGGNKLNLNSSYIKDTNGILEISGLGSLIFAIDGAIATGSTLKPDSSDIATSNMVESIIAQHGGGVGPYLPLSGGTMTGDIISSNGNYDLKYFSLISQSGAGFSWDNATYSPRIYSISDGTTKYPIIFSSLSSEGITEKFSELWPDESPIATSNMVNWIMSERLSGSSLRSDGKLVLNGIMLKDQANGVNKTYVLKVVNGELGIEEVQ